MSDDDKLKEGVLSAIDRDEQAIERVLPQLRCWGLETVEVTKRTEEGHLHLRCWVQLGLEYDYDTTYQISLILMTAVFEVGGMVEDIEFSS